MVSQGTVRKKKKTLNRSPARFHGRRSPRSSPLKDIVASIDRSVRTCRRRLLKLFTRLSSLNSCSSPPARSHKIKLRNHGFVLLDSSEEDAEDLSGRRPQIPLPISRKRRTLFLDLDETLVHSQIAPPPGKCDFVVRPAIGGQILTFYVLKRPGLDLLLEEAAEKQFEVVVFTAGVEAYASLVLDRIDPGKEVISHRLYRDSCTEKEGILVKDLSDLGRDLSTVAIVDDNPNSYSLQPGNAVPVAPFVDDLADRELWRVMEFLAMAAEFEDTRDAIKAFLSAAHEQPSSLI